MGGQGLLQLSVQPCFLQGQRTPVGQILSQRDVGCVIPTVRRSRNERHRAKGLPSRPKRHAYGRPCL
jgi:hypothetical protein